MPPRVDNTLRMALQRFPRQALHAEKLVLKHPKTGRETEWLAPIPEDMATLCRVLMEDAEKIA